LIKRVYEIVIAVPFSATVANEIWHSLSFVTSLRWPQCIDNTAIEAEKTAKSRLYSKVTGKYFMLRDGKLPIETRKVKLL